MNESMRSAAIIEALRKRTLRFLEQHPKCLDCGKELYHFSYKMVCQKCRKRKDSNNFLIRNPGYYSKYYQKNKKQRLMRQKRYYLIYADQINLRRKIKYYEKALELLGEKKKTAQDRA